MVIVPLPTAVGVPDRILVVVSNAIPAGSVPTAAYVGVGLPFAAGTVNGVIARPSVQT